MGGFIPGKNNDTAGFPVKAMYRKDGTIFFQEHILQGRFRLHPVGDG
jgi:hypothetical protein